MLRFPTICSSTCWTAFVLAVASPVPGQEVKHLPASTAESAEPLSSVSGLRPLSDGTLLVADGLEGRLLRVSADLATATPLGREGAGPEEYRTPDALFATSADSTVMVDLGNGRLATLAPDGSIVRTMPIASGGGPDLKIMMPRAVDASGRIYYREMGRPGPGGRPDSAAVIRYDPRTDESERLGAVKLPDMDVQESGGANNQQRMVRPVPLSAEDAWAATPDGRLVLARSDDRSYWLEFRGPGGATSGPRIPYEPQRVREADREAWIASLAGALGVSVEMENGRVRTSFSRGGGPQAEADDFEWPETKPPFPPGALRVALDGRFWLERHGAANAPATYDVLDGSGRRVGTVELPPGRELAAFSGDGVLLSRTDELDFVWLERHPLPSFQGAP